MKDRDVISGGSKSFYLASLFFSKATKEASWKIYRWCRFSDDLIDSAPNLPTALLRLQNLRSQTLFALDENTQAKDLSPEFLALREVCQKYEIPSRYPLDLIKGFEMDATGKKYDRLEDVELYSYHVAGVVGLMMAKVFGVKSPEVLQKAVDLGCAMQLTNIARDIQEDYLNHRIYLPADWLNEMGIRPEELLDSKNKTLVFKIVDRLLERADQLYRSGYQGLKDLPLRAAIAVSIAGSIYSFIGFKVRRQRLLHKRAVVSLPEKIALVLGGGWRALTMRRTA